MISAGGPGEMPPRDRKEPHEPWFTCLPPCNAGVPCGQGVHTVRWEAGTIRLLEHSDPEAELVLAALGGEKARCVEVAEAWERHADDLAVLAIGPRGPADEVAVGWDDVDEAAQAGPPGGLRRSGPMGPAGAMRPAGPTGYGPMRIARPLPPTGLPPPGARRQQLMRELEQVQRRRNDLLSLLALGYGFQARLAGQVVAAHADGPAADEDGGRRSRPTLTAALSGRLAPAAEEWLGLDPRGPAGPGRVEVSLHRGPGWGAAELAGRGEQRRLRLSLPAGWLPRVWAAGLALAGTPAGRHLVVAVERGGWPDARVLALRAPGTEPVLLDVHARGSAGDGGQAGGYDAPHWEV